MDYFNILPGTAPPGQDLLPELSDLIDSSSQGAINSNFDPLPRARSNTWPCRPSVEEQPATPTYSENQQQNEYLQKKQTSRRNAWGNMSYADLITQAIGSSPEKRLTLSQIYDWMVGNVGYFKDKGDSNSSAGWKNSIRHNLSLHNRFVRVQNEGTGKSSWWMLNPDAKPGKAARRRATSMETSKYEKKRGRIRKKIEALRNGTILDTPSPCSSLSEGLDLFPVEGEPPPPPTQFQLSPGDFRPRASSNASSCGRLSPILGESDLHDSQVPPLSPWPDYSNHYTPPLTTNINYSSLGYGLEEVQLAGNLANMVKIQEFGSQDPSFYSFDERAAQMGQDFYDFKPHPHPPPPTSTTTPPPPLPSLLSSNHTHKSQQQNQSHTHNSSTAPNELVDFGFDQLGQFEHDILANVELVSEMGEWQSGQNGQNSIGNQQQGQVLYYPTQQPQQQPGFNGPTPVTSSSSSTQEGRMWVH